MTADLFTHQRIQERILREIDKTMGEILDDGEIAEYAICAIITEENTRIIGGGKNNKRNLVYAIMGMIESYAKSVGIPREKLYSMLSEAFSEASGE